MTEGNGQQLNIQPTTTLPAAPQIVPSIASLVKAKKSLDEMVQILGVTRDEVQIRLEAAGLVDAWKEYASQPATAAPLPPPAEVQVTTNPGGSVTAQIQADAQPETKVETQAAVTTTTAAAPPPEQFVRRRGRSAAAAPPPPTAPLDGNARFTKAEAAAHGHPPMSIDDDQLALALGKLTIVAMKTGVSIEQLLEWTKIVLRAERGT